MSGEYTQAHATYQAHRLTLAGTGEDAFARSLISARVEMNPHQVNAALFALKSPIAKGVLLADEVGLGKTIEAGLVISQRWAEHKRKLLLIVPASLRKQWQQELWDKFTLPSHIIEARTYREISNHGSSPWSRTDGVMITSYEFAARKADELQAVGWNLIVFDEAHRLRNVYRADSTSRSQALKKALRDPFKILLTATPLQNSLLELYGLISVIDDKHFGGEDAFREQYGRSASPAALAVLRDRLEPICHRTLRRQVQEAGHINFRRREARTFHFEPKDLEAELYDRLSAFLQDPETVSYGGKPNALVILQARKTLGSSTFAITQYLSALLARLRKQQGASVLMDTDLEGLFEDDEVADDSEGTKSVDPAKLAAEIAEVQALHALASSIGANAKGDMLLDHLPEVLDQIVAKGGQRKAVVFTESVRTQRYLASLLEASGYEGQVILLNGSNNDPESRKVYEAWKSKHAGTDRISGSRSADMKAAIVDAFRDDKTILLATESGAEGINLQFCSLVINYDLPWNPQRVEQRIGRCHRYGQKIDVTVVNLLNLKNQAEQRIHELLSTKFHLFEGVFGASDEVLGTLMSGLDFEKEVVRIVQNCRTEAEAEAEFAKLTSEIQDQIDQDVEDARARVLENLDAEVVNKLHHRQAALKKSLPEFQQRLMIVARGELALACFDAEGERFEYDGATYTVRWPIADEKDWRFFRVNEGLGAELVERARSRDFSSPIALHFRPDDFPFGGRLAALDDLSGRSGWLRIAKARVLTGETAREAMLLAMHTDAGEVMAAEIADRLMLSPAEVVASHDVPPEPLISELIDGEAARFGERVKQENYDWLEAEEDRLDRYAEDVALQSDAKIRALESEIKEIQKQRRDPSLAMDEKLKLGRQVKRLEEEVDDLKMTKFERRRAARKEAADMLDAFSDMLNAALRVEPIMTLRWSIA